MPRLQASFLYATFWERAVCLRLDSFAPMVYVKNYRPILTPWMLRGATISSRAAQSSNFIVVVGYYASRQDVDLVDLLAGYFST